jgi:maleylpyruvate isomerase
MNALDRDLAGALAAHRTVESVVADLTDEQASAPSLLPDWTMGHVLTHIARNADSFVGMVEAAGRGEVGAQYPGGGEQRRADIEAGSGRSAAELRADVTESNSRLEAAWAALSPEAWEGAGLTVAGPVTMHELPFRRRRETLVHTADLGLGYSWRDWPDEYVRLDLQVMAMVWTSRQPMGLTGLPQMARSLSDHERLAWLLGRIEVPGLDAAGVF